MTCIDKLNIALTSTGYIVDVRLVSTKGDYISRICLVEKVSGIVYYNHSSINAVIAFLRVEYGERWVRVNNIDEILSSLT